jgi:peptidoglycan hydrolase-like protein with peptidoglycan-binding domain
MAEPWDDDVSYWDQQSQSYMTGSEKSSDGQTLDEPWEYQTDDYGYTTHDDSQATGYTSARITQVKRIQEALLRNSFNPGTIDGKWGPKTCGAMLGFQTSRFGSAKANWLDVETWSALGFDASTSRLFEDLYGMSCGGTPPKDWTGAGSGTNVQVTLSDIQKIQYAIGVLTTGKFDKATCEELFRRQRALGDSSTALGKRLFETLGFTSSEAQKLSTQIGQGCIAFAPKSTTTTTTGGGGTVVVPKPVDPAGPIEPKTASIGWWVFGGILAVGVGNYFYQKSKGRR